MPALAPCCLPEANSCDEQQSFQCAEWPGDWYGTMGNVTQQSWLGSNCNALQVFFCQYGTYYSSQLYDCGMECPGEPPVVPGCTAVSACNYDPDANEDDGSCWYVGTTPCSCSDGPDCYVGCTDDTAINYDPDAYYHNDDSCEYPVNQPPTISVQVN